MLDRVCLGQVPRKHHTVLRTPSDGALCYEHCVTRQGFEGPYSILYHRSLPPRDVAHRLAELPGDPAPAADDQPLHRRHLKSGLLQAQDETDVIGGRRVLLCNAEVALGLCTVRAAAPRYLQNGDGDDLYFAHAGRGVVESVYGPLPYAPGDYVLVPRGTPYRLVPESGREASVLFLIEGRTFIEVPRQFRNGAGQLRMDAPYSHRDFRRPERLPDPALAGPGGTYTIVVKRGGRYHEIIRDRDPFDVVGWDGHVYPVALSIHDYQAKVGRIHLPPTIFTTFTGGGFLVCSFVPRPLDYGEGAIPCPYPHSSVHCDEVIFYVSGNFTSRRGIGPGSISLHPSGLTHGPQPGAYEASIGKDRTTELAVMIDTFQQLHLTADALSIEDPAYHDSWGV